VVVLARDEQERRAIVVVEVHVCGGTGVEVGERALEEHASRTGHGVAVERRLGLLFTHRVGERVVNSHHVCGNPCKSTIVRDPSPAVT
jgi:hypothetical protein